MAWHSLRYGALASADCLAGRLINHTAVGVLDVMAERIDALAGPSRKTVQALIGETRRLLRDIECETKVAARLLAELAFCVFFGRTGASPAPGPPPFLKFAVTHALW